MKKYLKNKDFIPEDFYKVNELSINRNERNMIAILTIINLCFFPFTSESMMNIHKKNNANIVETKNIKQKITSIDNINTWIECVIESDIKEAYITMNEGEILVDNFDEINKLSSNKLIRINDINLNSDNRYKLGVSLDE
ncbi:hypothetical protein D2A34_16270 [Clostridium chromiireducens]|uniref:Uncharacterized protein n=3 Tax=Clostridium chromiireducens TaxID=225345 RepID=A0A399IQX3_9CLOT|nr:hypothetical protein [Clostridium chromiireducens]RII33306.1 hypothetical protein D2A34_16270 [Clostridium chromiireducens]